MLYPIENSLSHQNEIEMFGWNANNKTTEIRKIFYYNQISVSDPILSPNIITINSTLNPKQKKLYFCTLPSLS